MTRSPERTQFLADLLTAALAGGVGHWADIVAVQDVHGHEPAGDYFEEFAPHVELHYARIIDTADGTPFGTPHDIDLDTMEKGLHAIASDPLVEIPELLLANHSNGRDGNIDPAAAGAVIQHALYGAVLYD